MRSICVALDLRVSSCRIRHSDYENLANAWAAFLQSCQQAGLPVSANALVVGDDRDDVDIGDVAPIRPPQPRPLSVR